MVGIGFFPSRVPVNKSAVAKFGAGKFRHRSVPWYRRENEQQGRVLIDHTNQIYVYGVTVSSRSRLGWPLAINSVPYRGIDRICIGTIMSINIYFLSCWAWRLRLILFMSVVPVLLVNSFVSFPRTLSSHFRPFPPVPFSSRFMHFFHVFFDRDFCSFFLLVLSVGVKWSATLYSPFGLSRKYVFCSII